MGRGRACAAAADEEPGSDCGLTVESPSGSQAFPLSSGYNSATLPLSVSSNCIGTQATWVFDFSYTSSSGTTYQAGEATTTTTLGQSTNWQSPAGVGGQGNVTVTASVTGATAPPTTTLQCYIDGTTIPNSAITSQLVGLYSGATPALLTGIAWRESSYQQFVSRSAYSVSGLWPNESSGGGYVGLMQVPNAMNVAFDWTQNAAAGATVFQQKVSKSQSVVSGYQASCKGLPGLTGTQLENDALVYYGSYAGSGPYYVPNTNCTGWITNPNNSNGVSYANSVRADIQ